MCSYLVVEAQQATTTRFGHWVFRQLDEVDVLATAFDAPAVRSFDQVDQSLERLVFVV